MDNTLYKIAVNACAGVYKENIDLGTTEYSITSLIYKDNVLQILAIAGTNEMADWWKNVNIRSKNGIKKVAVDAAKEIHENFKERISSYKLLVCGHSKAGPTAMAYKELYGADYCVAFCPARAFRPWNKKKMDNTTIFIDPDDLVPKLGRLFFTHPECNIITLPNDHKGWYIKDHHINHLVDYVNNMENL